MTLAMSVIEPPVGKRELSKRDAERLRRNIELFVDGVMDERHSLAELLNESFTMDMLDLLFKRMTCRLRSILFSRQKSMELLAIALDPALPRHTRSLATSFLVIGSAASCVVACPKDEHRCQAFWDTIFGALEREAANGTGGGSGVAASDAAPATSPATATASPSSSSSAASAASSAAPAADTAATANGDGAPSSSDISAAEELEALIEVEVKDIEHHGARSLQRSFIEQVHAQIKDTVTTDAACNGGTTHAEDDEDELERSRTSHGDDDDDDDNDHELVGNGSNGGDRHLHNNGGGTATPTSARASVLEDKDDDDNSAASTPTASPVSTTTAAGIFSADTANFSSQILRYFAIRGQRGGCILRYVADHPGLVDLLLANIGHDDTRTMLLHLVYADHSEAAMQALFASGLIERMLERLVSFAPPRNAFERDGVENTFLLLREIIHAPYLTARGVAISAKTIPLDKVTGQDEYVSICGASREMANSALRKYTSRKVRHIVHLFVQDNQRRLEQLFLQMIRELTFWSSPAGPHERERRGSVSHHEALESLSLLRVGHPRPTCTTLLAHLFELTETVDFTEEHGKGAGPNSAAAATSVGIDCLNFMCTTHLVQTGRLLIKKKLRNELQGCEVHVNCMMGVRVTLLKDEPHAGGAVVGGNGAVVPAPALDSGFQQMQGTQTNFTLDEIQRVDPSDWHAHGFTITVRKKTTTQASHGHELGLAVVSDEPTEFVTDEYFAATSDDERDQWIARLRAVINGDLPALEIFCSDDWRSNVREYRKLRECLITSMERKGHELMVFLRQVIVHNHRRASGYHLWSIVKFLNAVASNESKRLDQMFVSAQLLAVLILCYEKYPTWSLVLGEITKLIIFCIGDFKNKRSRRCPIITKLLSSADQAKLLPLLTRTFVDTDGGRQSPLYGTDAFSNLKLIMESIKLCHRDPRTRSQERIQAVLKSDAKWQRLLEAFEDESTRNPEQTITSVPSPSSIRDALTPAAVTSVAAPLQQPAFQEHIINQITRPCYSSAHGFGSSFLLGDGCTYGYMFKERHGGTKWQKCLLVYEHITYKLWYFYPSEVDETHRIRWRWIVPIAVKSRYTHGHDETHSSVGHHGLFVTAYEQEQEHHSLVPHHHPVSTRELHFSVTKLEDRDQWKAVLSKAAETIQQLSRDYNLMSAKLKKPDKKTITHCQNKTCGLQFKLFRRPHSCKRCGKWFCSKCSQQRLTIPEFGLMHPVRHCRPCFDAAGGVEAEVEPANLFGRSSRDSNTSTASDGGDSETSRLSFNNPELYELAHGMVSPRSLMQLRRRMTRQDSIDSPTNACKVDELDGLTAEQQSFFGDDFGNEGNGDGDDEDEEQLSPYNSPPPSPLLLPVPALEDTRG